MHYPVMTEKHLADRWQVSLKTLRRWRLDNEGPVWYKLFRHVRYHEADILEFERSSAQHLMTLLGINHEFKPADVEVGEELDVDGGHYLTAKEIAEAASLPIHLFRDQAECNRKCVPHLMLVGNLRFSLPAILEWEMANSEYAVSLALSDHLSSKDQLAQYSHELRNGNKLSVPREALAQALDALKDPQLLTMLGAQPAPPTPAPSAQAAARQHQPATSAAPQRTTLQPPPIKPELRLTKTALHQSPFAALGVTTRDDRRRIVELAEEKSLSWMSFSSRFLRMYAPNAMIVT